MRRDDHDNEAVVVVPELEGMSVAARKRWKTVGGEVGQFWGTIRRALGVCL
jgi:hypothetical protein